MCGFHFKQSCNCTIHRAPSGLTILKQRSIGDSLAICCKCEHTCLTYHSWNCLCRNSLAALFTLRSRGCSLSVQLGGISMTFTLLSSSNVRSSDVHWPLKLSNISTARWSGGSLSCLRLLQMYGKIILLIYWCIVCSLHQWFAGVSDTPIIRELKFG